MTTCTSPHTISETIVSFHRGRRGGGGITENGIGRGGRTSHGGISDGGVGVGWGGHTFLIEGEAIGIALFLKEATGDVNGEFTDRGGSERSS